MIKRGVKMNYYFKVLSKYAVFSGRARRKEYWMFVLMNFLLFLAIGFVGAILRVNAKVLETLINVYQLAILIPSIAAGVRRMHDTGKSGWYLLIPIYNLILACTRGDEGANEYGPDPIAEEEAGKSAGTEAPAQPGNPDQRPPVNP